MNWWAIPEHSILVQFRRLDEDDGWKVYGKVLAVPLEEAMDGENRGQGMQHMQHVKIVGLAEKTTYKIRLQAEKDGHLYEPSEELTIDTQAPHWPMIHILSTFCSGTDHRAISNCSC